MPYGVMITLLDSRPVLPLIQRNYRPVCDKENVNGWFNAIDRT